MKPVRIALIGFGSIARTHLIALKALPIVKKLPYLPVVDTLITRDPAANEAQARAIGFSSVVSTLEEALATRELEAVDICTPNALHLNAARSAIDAGLRVYCEKPLTDTYERSKELAALAPGGASGHQTALVFRYHPAVRRIAEALRRGVIGRPLQARFSYRRSGYLDAAKPLSWRMTGDLSGGGAITDLGVHVLDLISHLFGGIAAADGETHMFVKERRGTDGSGVPRSVDDWAQFRLSLPGGVEATAEVSRIAWGVEAFDVTIIGSEGSISCDLERDTKPRIRRLDGSSPAIPDPASMALLPDEKATMGNAMDSHFASLNHFLHRMVGEDRWAEERLTPTFQDCLEAERIIDAILQKTRAR